LQKSIEKRERSFFEGRKISIDFKRIFQNFNKVFYYDCYSERRDGEAEEAYKIRKSQQDDFFNSLRSIDGCHVHLGSISGEGDRQRQKQVDVKIAVHMLTHTWRKNMDRVTLLSGDLDYKPLIDALVQEGMHVVLWHDPSSTSKELVYSADSKRILNIREIWQCGAKD